MVQFKKILRLFLVVCAFFLAASLSNFIASAATLVKPDETEITYASFEEALDAAETGDTINLFVSEPLDKDIDKDITINLITTYDSIIITEDLSIDKATDYSDAV